MQTLPVEMLGAFSDYVSTWQIILFVVLIGLIIFYFQYRKRQM